MAEVEPWETKCLSDDEVVASVLPGGFCWAVIHRSTHFPGCLLVCMFKSFAQINMAWLLQNMEWTV